MDTSEYGVGGFEIWRMWVPPSSIVTAENLQELVTRSVYFEHAVVVEGLGIC